MSLENLPYKENKLEYKYISLENKYMLAAQEVARISNCYKQRVGCVIVSNGKIISTGNNGVNVPQESCPRESMKTGQGYELCEIHCGGNLHAEEAACAPLKESEKELSLYLYGHWWFCNKCCDLMVKNNIKKVYLLEGSSQNTTWW